MHIDIIHDINLLIHIITVILDSSYGTYGRWKLCEKVVRIIVQQQQQQKQTPPGQNQIAQQPPHQQQQTRDQHEVQTQGNCAKLAAEEFATLEKI